MFAIVYLLRPLSWHFRDPRYWHDVIFKLIYTPDAKTGCIEDWAARIQWRGRRKLFNLKTPYAAWEIHPVMKMEFSDWAYRPPAALLTVEYDLRGRFAFKLCAHLLDLRGLLFQACSDGLNFLLLLRGNRPKVLLLLRYCGF